MKKMILGIFTVLSMASCGEKLLTPEQVNAKVEEGFTAQKATIEAEESAKCDAEFQTRVSAEVDRLKADYEAAKATVTQ